MRESDKDKEIQRLRNYIADLEERSRSNRSIGRDGETYVAERLGGELMPSGCSFDVRFVRRDGVTLKMEVKKSGLVEVAPHKRTLYWAWHSLLGHLSNKVFDRLLLVGEPDLRYAIYYQSPGARYVLFDIPYDQIKRIAYRGGDRHLTSNPKRVQNHIGRELYTKWQVSEADLLRRLELWKRGGKRPLNIIPEHWWKVAD